MKRVGAQPGRCCIRGSLHRAAPVWIVQSSRVRAGVTHSRNTPMLNAPLLTAAVDAFKIPDLRRKLLFTFGMLVASRFIAHVPVPGADLNALQRVFQTNQLAGFFDLFSGGALSSLSVAALGVYPSIDYRSNHHADH